MDGLIEGSELFCSCERHFIKWVSLCTSFKDIQLQMLLSQVCAILITPTYSSLGLKSLDKVELSYMYFIWLIGISATEKHM